MDFDSTIVKLIRNGGVIKNVGGSTVSEIYENVCSTIELPDGYDNAVILSELLEREKVLSTAVGNGVAIPHPRRPLMKTEADQRMYVCYLRTPLDMQAPDSRKVHALFILLTSNTQFHIKALSELARLLRSPEFKKVLESHPDADELIAAIK